MMIARFITRAALAAAILAGLSGCRDGFFQEEGGPVRFCAATSYPNTLDTKTVYSNELFGTEKRYERIDWVAGDLLRICSDRAVAPGGRSWADYSVKEVTADGRKSRATLDNYDRNGLVWAEGENTFYAFYPSPQTEGVDPQQVGLDGPSFQGVIPRDQQVVRNDNTGVWLPDMRFAYLWAATKADSRTGNVSLAFQPAMTAFQFTFGSGGPEALRLERFELVSSSSALTGAFTATITHVDGEQAAADYVCPPFAAGENDVITVDFGGSGQPTVVEAGQTLSFTILALPQDLTDLTVRFHTDRGIRSLALSLEDGTPLVFPARKKIRISGLEVSAEVWHYTFETYDPTDLVFNGGTSTSGFVSSSRSNGTVREPVAWEIDGYYSDPDCTLPYNGHAEIRPSWITRLTPESGSGGTDRLRFDYTAETAVTEHLTDVATVIEAAIAEKGVLGSSSRPLNLSAPGAPQTDDIAESANCYVVNARGWYRIPLATGCGIRNNAPEPVAAAYMGSNAADCRLFVDYKGNPVQHPLLHRTSASAGTPTSAFIVWEDVPGLIEAGGDYALGSGAITSTGRGDSQVFWLNFHVAQARQGNAVLAVADENGTVMWSYHIWVSDYVPRQGRTIGDDVAVTAYDPARVFLMMPRNLGAVIIGEADVQAFNARDVYVRLRQLQGGRTTVLHIAQPGHVQLDTYPDRVRSPYYQWGRKDAMWPNDGYGNVEPHWYGRFPSLQVQTRPAELEESIRTPGLFYAAGEDRHWLADAGRVHAYNLWNAGSASSAWDYGPVTKTIYDPSPAGYCLPPAAAFSGFTTTGDATDNLQEVRADLDRGFIRGGWFYTDDSRTETIFFPTQGNRNATGGRLYGMEEIAYAFYWTAGQGYFPYYGYNFYFYAYGDSRSGYAYIDPRYCYHVSCGHPVRPVRR